MASRDIYHDTESLAIGEVARRAGVSVETIREWDRTGKLRASFRTPGGQRRFRSSEVEALLAPQERAS